MSEPDLEWTTSSYSNSFSNCVQVTNLPDGVGVRDSKNPNGPILRFTRMEWLAFLGGVRNDEFDRFGMPPI